MKNIFLAGGGSAENSYFVDQAFLQSLKPQPKVLYLPIALPEAEHSYQSCLDWMRSALEPHGVGPVTMWPAVNDRSLTEVREFDAIYFGGGNTYTLLRDLRDSGFDSVLREYWSDGGTIYGGSAGAIVLGSDIGTCAHIDDNHIGLIDTEGLNLLGGHAVWCHYDESVRLLANKYAERTGINVVAIREQGGLQVNDLGATVIGVTAVYFEDRAVTNIGPGSTIRFH